MNGTKKSGSVRTVLLFNPPGGFWLRGEARCEQDIDLATAYTYTPPTNLAYLAAILRNNGITPVIRDYPAEKLDWDSYRNDLKKLKPELLILNASVLNLLNDLEAFSISREILPDSARALFVPYFNSLPESTLEKNERYGVVDYFITGEAENIIMPLVECVSGNIAPENVKGIFYQASGGKIVKTPPAPAVEDLDGLPFPARDLLKNELYLRPDTGRPMATIFDSKGCPSQCIFCLAPITTGTRVRKRSVNSVVAEIKECVERYRLSDFLFRADTFTIKPKWVLEFCEKVRAEKLKIRWAANSRTNTFTEELGRAMKAAGCYLVEFGTESGSDETLRRMRKGATVEQSRKAVKAAKKCGLKAYCTFLIGFPWDTREDIEKSKKYFFNELKPDFLEIQMIGPYMGTEFYEMAKEYGLIDGDTIGHDMVLNPAIKGTLHLSREELVEMRKSMLREFYTQPKFVLRTLLKMRSLSELRNYFVYGMRMLKNTRR